MAQLRSFAFCVALASSLTSCFLVHEHEAGCEACDASVRDAPLADAGACLCAPIPHGCTYDGPAPCVCSHMTCEAERCGRAVCGPGTMCCNATCGVCTPPGIDCASLACTPDCTPQDAHSGGRCLGSPGWAWDGQACRALSCNCVGSECDAIYATEDACHLHFSGCEAADCATDDATGAGGCAAVLGYAFTTRGCVALSGCSCTGADCGEVVGRTEQACTAEFASCPILFI